MIRRCLVLFLALLVFGCETQSTSFANTGGTGSLGASQPGLVVQVTLGSQALAQGSSPPFLSRVELEVYNSDGETVLTRETKFPSALRSTTLTYELPDLEPGQNYRVVARGYDIQGQKVVDAEGFELAGPVAHFLPLRLSSVQETVSAIFGVVPSVRLTPAASKQLEETAGAALLQQGFRLSEDRLLWSPGVASSWIVEIGGERYLTDPQGRFRGPRPPSDITEGFLIHPESEEFRASFDITDLSSGQETDLVLLMGVTFSGGCGMSLGEQDEMCGPLEAVPMGPDAGRVLAQAVRNFPLSTTTTNRCGVTIPKPTEVVERNRGSYPAPAQIHTLNGVRTEVFSPCHQDCEKYNGFIMDTQRTGPGQSSYVGSTCWRMVNATCCLNEVPRADELFNLELSPGNLGLGDIMLPGSGPVLEYLFGSRIQWYVRSRARIAFTKKPIIPKKATACLDNHKGRQCQQVKIGDISLDFRNSGKAGLVYPDSPSPKIFVAPGETVDFVLHNNGCFGVTTMTMPKQGLKGVLDRTYREVSLTPRTPAQDTNPNPVVRLQSSNDPLLTSGATPTTSGLFQPTAVPAASQIRPGTERSDGRFSERGRIKHFLEDPKAPKKVEDCTRFRYYPDVAMRYTAPASFKSGEDVFRFESDHCPVIVTFVMVPGEDGQTSGDGSTGGETGGSSGGETSGGSTGPSPMVSFSLFVARNGVQVSLLSSTHQLNPSVPSRVVGTINVTNTGNVPVNFATSLTDSPEPLVTLELATDINPTDTNVAPNESRLYRVRSHHFEPQQSIIINTRALIRATSTADNTLQSEQTLDIDVTFQPG